MIVFDTCPKCGADRISTATGMCSRCFNVFCASQPPPARRRGVAAWKLLPIVRCVRGEIARWKNAARRSLR